MWEKLRKSYREAVSYM